MEHVNDGIKDSQVLAIRIINHSVLVVCHVNKVAAMKIRQLCLWGWLWGNCCILSGNGLSMMMDRSGHGGHHGGGGWGWNQGWPAPYHNDQNLDLYSLLGGLSFASLLGATILFLATRNTSGRRRRSLDGTRYVDDDEFDYGIDHKSGIKLTNLLQFLDPSSTTI